MTKTKTERCKSCGEALVWQPYGMKCAFCGYCRYFKKRKTAKASRRRNRQ